MWLTMEDDWVAPDAPAAWRESEAAWLGFWMLMLDARLLSLRWEYRVAVYLAVVDRIHQVVDLLTLFDTYHTNRTQLPRIYFKSMELSHNHWGWRLCFY